METGDQAQRMLVFDFGGGTLDRSIMRVASSAVQVLAADVIVTLAVVISTTDWLGFA
jgi:molecular chaperone DnaK (HSP70)